jgi:hypothetical protein
LPSTDAFAPSASPSSSRGHVMAEVRKYEVGACPKCGQQMPPDLQLPEDGEGYAMCPTCEVRFESLSATDDRDIQPLVGAARVLVAEIDQFAGESDSLARSVNVSWGPLFTARDSLRERLAPFDSKEDTTSSSPDETNSTRTSFDGSRLQELLQWVEYMLASTRRVASETGDDDPRAISRLAAIDATYSYIAQRIHRLQANEEKGGEDG